MTMKRTYLHLLALVVVLPCVAHAQTTRPPLADNDPFQGRRPTDAANQEDDAANKFLQHRMAEARKVDRKRRMVDTANRLLVLTKQLQADLQGRPPSPEDEKRLDEIARLARSVKDQMRQ